MARPRTPTALKVVGGTQRADRRNGQEPEPPVLFEALAPAHLSQRSRAVWQEIAPLLISIKVLTAADVIALEMLCDAVADYRLAREQRGEKMVAWSHKGSQMLDQLLVAQQSFGKRAEALMARFGMDPSSRSRILVDPGQGDLFPADGRSASRFFK